MSGIRSRSPYAGRLLLGVWLAGTVLMLLRAAHACGRVSRYVRSAAALTDEGVVRLCADLAREAGLRRMPQLLCSSAGGSPFTWGLVNPVIVLPQVLTQGRLSELRPVLLHELAHIRRRDAWVGCVQRIVSAMYWWNPVVHRLNVRLADAREQLCDAHVLEAGCPPHEYARILVELASRVALPQPASMLGLLSRSESQLSRRVQHLLQEDPLMSTSLSRLSKILVAGFALILCAAVFAFAVRSESSEQPRRTIVTAAPRHYVAPAVEGPRPNDLLGPAVRISGPAAMAGPMGGPRPNAPLDPPGDLLAPPAMAGASMAGPRLSGMPAGGSDPQQMVIVQLIANDDGSLKELRWFTQSLGTGDEAFAALESRMADAGHHRELDPSAAAGAVQVQITADPKLRYEYVARVIQICERHRAHIALTHPDAKAADLTLTLAFVRDAEGRKLSDSPVLIWKNFRFAEQAPIAGPSMGMMGRLDRDAPAQDQIIPIEELASSVRHYRDFASFPAVAAAAFGAELLAGGPMAGVEPSPLAVLESDPDVSADVVQRVVRQLRAAGVVRVILRPLTGANGEAVLKPRNDEAEAEPATDEAVGEP